MQKKNLIVTHLGVIVAGALAGLTAPSLRVLYAQTLGVRTPVTITYLEVVRDGSGKQRSVQTVAHYVRADGVVVNQTTVPWPDASQWGPDSFERRLILNPIDRSMVELFPKVNKSKATTRLDEATATRLLQPSGASCATDTYKIVPSDVKTIQGYAVVALSLQQQENQSNRVRMEQTQWRALELGCAVLREHVLTYRNGALVSDKSKNPATIVSGDPPAGMFVVPDDFVERKPSELIEELGKLRGTTPAECERNTGRMADLNYSARGGTK